MLTIIYSGKNVPDCRKPACMASPSGAGKLSSPGCTAGHPRPAKGLPGLGTPGAVGAHCRHGQRSPPGWKVSPAGPEMTVVAGFAPRLGIAVKLRSGRPRRRKSLQTEKQAVSGHPGADRFLVPPGLGPGAPPTDGGQVQGRPGELPPRDASPRPGDGGQGTQLPLSAPSCSQIPSQEDSHLHCSEKEPLYCAPSPVQLCSLWLWSLC